MPVCHGSMNIGDAICLLPCLAATLVTGQFEVTKDILKDFAKLQDRDTTSVTCGRIPNRANLEGILYNTADGTPRYVIEAEELLRLFGRPQLPARYISVCCA